MIDLGLSFADEQFPGVDLLVPKINFIEDVKDNLTNEFLSIVDKTNINLISKSETQKEDLTNYINNFLKEESKNLLEIYSKMKSKLLQNIC